MKTILCFGDSNTWGWNPKDQSRYLYDQRWPGIMQSALGPAFRVIEEGLPGRTTVRDDPLDDYKNGKTYLLPCLYSHAPIDLVILMLGSNELKSYFHLSASDIASSAGELVSIIKQCAYGPCGSSPQVLLAAPAKIDPPPGSELDDLFAGGKEKSNLFGRFFSEIAVEKNCHFLDAGTLITPSPVDGVHLEVEAHEILGEALAFKVGEIFSEG